MVEKTALDRSIEQGALALGELETFLEERNVDPLLHSRVYGIQNHLRRFDNREARRFELNYLERLFSPGHTEWDRAGRQALALWRLHQQLLDHRD